MRYLTSLRNWIVVLLCAFSFNATASKIAIVIDDIGYKQSDKNLIDMNEALTYAVLPHTPLGTKLAQQATLKNRDVIIHLPMQAHSDNRLLGPGALYSKMTKSEYQQTLVSAMEDLPFAIGVNNHMGSLLTQQSRPMSWTMEFLRQHNLFFLDSRTTKYSKVAQVADDFGVDTINRNVFLDHNRSPAAIRKQFYRLIKVAKRDGHAVAIGHPHPETYAVLKEQLPKLSSMGIELVPLSDLMKQTSSNSLFANKLEDNEEAPDILSNSTEDYAPKE